MLSQLYISWTEKPFPGQIVPILWMMKCFSIQVFWPEYFNISLPTKNEDIFELEDCRYDFPNLYVRITIAIVTLWVSSLCSSEFFFFFLANNVIFILLCFTRGTVCVHVSVCWLICIQITLVLCLLHLKLMQQRKRLIAKTLAESMSIRKHWESFPSLFAFPSLPTGETAQVMQNSTATKGTM